MKTKKVLISITILLFVITIIMILPNNVFAAETMSDEFKQILNDEGKLVVTDTTMLEDKNTFLNEYIQYTTDSDNFSVSNYNEESSTCDIVISHTGEKHNIEVIYEEKISKTFKSILKNGKLPIPSSSKNNVKEIMDRYLYRMSESNEKYEFLYSSYGSDEDEVILIDKDYTKVTIKMQDVESSRIQEQHTIEILYLTKPSQKFEEKLNLNKNGELVVNSIEPKDEQEMFWLLDILFNEKNDDDTHYSFAYPAKDFSAIDVTMNYYQADEETHRIDVVYNYDKKIKEKFKDFVNNFPEDIEYFYVKDLELINYWIYNVENDNSEHLDAYSGELKAAVNNNNIKYYVYNKTGDGGKFFTERLGIAIFEFNDFIYHIDLYLGTRAENIIYVSTETGNTKEELIEAAQKRINKYLGKEGMATISYAGTAYDIWISEQYETHREKWELDNPNMTLEEFISRKYEYIDPKHEENHFKYFFGENAKASEVSKNEDTYIITIKVGNKEKSFNILIKRDSSKMITPTYTTTDMTTNIEINSSSPSIPLDTTIQAEKITKGSEYERIIKLLNLKENEMFDLNLYSDSLENYITKLLDGTFEVRIPISEKFRGKKNLIVYYVDKNGKIKEYQVTVKGDFAIFNTDHFSIYTLAEKSITSEDRNEDENKDIGNVSGDKGNTNIDNTNINNDTDNPYTGDNILFYVRMLLVSAIGIVITIKFRKKFSK